MCVLKLYPSLSLSCALNRTLCCLIGHSYCPPPDSVTHGSYTLYNSDRVLTAKAFEGSRAVYKCEEGYRPNQEPTDIFCHFGEWIGHTTKCIKVESEDCYTPAQIENGQYELTYTSKEKRGSRIVGAGTRVLYYCNVSLMGSGRGPFF